MLLEFREQRRLAEIRQLEQQLEQRRIAEIQQMEQREQQRIAEIQQFEEDVWDEPVFEPVVAPFVAPVRPVVPVVAPRQHVQRRKKGSGSRKMTPSK